MASSPSYGDRPPMQGYRRSFTVPHKTLSLHERAALDRSDAAAEILYSHPSGRILSFAPPPESILSSSDVTLPDTDYPVDTVETLPWRSRTETLMASGPIIIEKVRGSTNFLKSGIMMHAILRNSQCWCVDGESKFVLRVRKFTYYRIELPSATTQDKEKVEELKTVLAKVLRFERSPCPFKRAFHVELPDDAITPRRKGTWKPTEGRLSMTDNPEFKPLGRTKNSRAWSMQLPSSRAAAAESNQGLKSDFGFRSGKETSPRQQYQNSDAETTVPEPDISPKEVVAESVEDEHSESGSSVGSVTDDAQKPTDQDPETSKSLHKVVSEDADQSIIRNGLGEEDIEDDESPSIADLHGIDESSLLAKPESEHNELPPGLVENPGFEREAPVTLDDADNQIDIPGQDRDDLSYSNTEIDPEPHTIIDTQEHAVNAESAEQHNELPTTDQADFIENSDIPVEPATNKDPTPELEDKTVSGTVTDMEDPMLPSDQHDEQAIIEPVSIEKVKETTTPTTAETEVVPEDTKSFASSSDSFHTLDSDKQESFRNHPDLDFLPRQHRRELSEVTVTASTGDENAEVEELDRFTTSQEINHDKPSTPTLTRSSASDTSWPEVVTPSSANIQDGLRKRQKSHRSLSPLPSSSNILGQPKQNQGSHLTSAILQRACTVALVKPIEVVVLFVHILVRIAGGATVNDLLSGELFRKPEQHRRNASFPDRVTTHRDNNDDDDDDERDVDEEDDFGVPLDGRRKASTAGKADGNDTDADSMFDLD